MQQRTAARLLAPSSEARIGTGVPQGGRRGDRAGLGREARRDGQLQRQEGKRAIEPAGTVLMLTQHCLLKTLVAARCCCCCYCCVLCYRGSLGTGLWLAGSSSSRPRPNVREVKRLKYTWYISLVVSEFAHTHSYVGVDFDCRHPRQRATTFFLCLIQPRTRRSWPRSVAAVARAVRFVAQSG